MIFVADPDARCVHRYDLRKRRYTRLVTSSGELLLSPVGLAVTEDGRVFVSDSQLGRIFQADLDSKRLSPFAVTPALVQPTGIFWDDAQSRLYVTDTGRQAIVVLDALGQQVQKIGERGNQQGQLNFPTYLWMDTNSDLLVTDSLNFRIQRFAHDASFLSEFGENGSQPGEFSRPKGIATDSFGHIYVVDALMHSMQIFSPAGDLLLAVGGQGRGEGEFWLPNGIFITGDDTIFVADSYNKRVQVFRYVGTGS